MERFAAGLLPDLLATAKTISHDNGRVCRFTYSRQQAAFANDLGQLRTAQRLLG